MGIQIIESGNKNIEFVVDKGLCTGCGTCAGTCPRDAITMIVDDKKGIYLPQISDLCNDCSFCVKVCPGYEVNFLLLNWDIFGKQPEDILLGNYSNCYTGYSTDYGIRYNSSSGGLVTQLLVYALEKGVINGVLVTRTKKGKPLEPEPFVARTRAEIISASGSKYCPVSANTAVKEILNSKEGEKFAIVGLPCHIHGIRKAEAISTKLKESIALHVGIFCGHAPTFPWTEFHLWRKGIKGKDIDRIEYRGRGWPGWMTIISKDGVKRFVPYNETWGYYSNFFYHKRCLFCCDQVAELADISCGDAWLPEFVKDNVGQSMVICRNMEGEKILQSAVAMGKLKLDLVDSRKAIQSQGGLYYKKRVIVTSFSYYHLRRLSIPKYNRELLIPRAQTYLKGFELHLEVFASSKRYFWGLMIAYVWLKTIIVKIVKSIIQLAGNTQ